MSMTQSVESAILAQTRRGLRTLLAVPAARAAGLARVEDLEIAGPGGPLRARYYEAPDAEPAPLMVYFHGGGFICCDIDTHDSICSWLAKSSRGRVLSVGYRLAPESRFPGQIEDTRAACAWAFQNAQRLGAAPYKLVLAGDSAGAYLAATMTLEINRATPGAIALQVLLYPLVHIQDSLWSQEELRNFRFLGRVAVRYIARSLGGEALPSLLDVDLTAAPPTIVAGGGAMDPVRSDVKAFVDALRRAGVEVTEKKYPMLMHGGLNFTNYSKTATTALQEVGELVRAAFAR
ncbi:alpha/beta hydrolase [Terricaulis silvestris]|uniref:Carboxylesterase NlhH n=1 Tax=Terricaulis silvestris TaxID=2686094 RepID=A0A6I6MKY6_9CAUL|nr:alpha/beta hydrolase [Terricaulis silvestris]QGZ96025.1 Carboxylesterase NlhH [Terricaulis silvestris]